jgi:hypothetical protein
LEAKRPNCTSDKKRISAIDYSRTNAKTLWTDAKHLLVGAEIISAAWRDATHARDPVRAGQLMQPALLLICSSLEAGFKAYLHRNGSSLKRLRKHFGHDLAKLHRAVLKRADAELAELLREGKDGIDLLTEPYLRKQFSYRQIGRARFPAPNAACEWIRDYLALLKPLIFLDLSPGPAGQRAAAATGVQKSHSRELP